MKTKDLMNSSDHTLLGAIQLAGIVLAYILGEIFFSTMFKVAAGIGSFLYAANQAKIFYNSFLKKYVIRILKRKQKP